MRHLAALPLLLAAALGVHGTAGAGEAVVPAPTKGPEVSVADLRAHLEVLASDAFGGRFTTDESGRKTAEYVAASLRRSGLSPKGVDGTWFQPYVVPLPVLGEGNRLSVHEGERSREFVLEHGWNPVSVTASGAVAAPLVFAGFGITAPKEGRDDYADLDVKGKVVLVLRRAPKRELLRHAALLAKLGAAVEHGAAALLVVNDAASVKEGGDVLLSWNAHIGAAVGSGKIPFGFVSRETAATLLGGPDELTALEAQAREGPAGRAVDGVEVRLRTAVSTTKEANAQNVVGFLTGRDPDLAEEVVVLGAHHDHVGLGSVGSLGGKAGEGQVHNGADDNASGTVALLELAEWFAQPKNRPRRSLLFLSFSGEELGLLGSEHYVKHPLVPLVDTVAMVNLDMVGRCTKGNLDVGGVGTAKGMKELVAAAAKPYAFEIAWDEQGEAPTDSTSFFHQRIPVLWLFTGLHADYHRPGDDVDKLCFDELADITRLTGDILKRLADADERVAFTDPPKPKPRPRLGIQPSQEPHALGVALQGVVPGGPAAVAGLLPGDVLLSVAGQTVRTVKDLHQVLGKLEPGKSVAVVVVREGNEVTVTVTLGG